MSINHRQGTTVTVAQSPGCDPKVTWKRSSGLFSFFKWFKSSPSRESSIPDLLSSSSSSCDSINSKVSTGTATSFSFISSKPFTALVQKSIVLGPETDTYKARLRERDKRRERDKNLTLRKKYNLFFNRETILKPRVQEKEDNSRSLPLMTRKMLENDDASGLYRRTNSESSKMKKAGAYCHVKGKRKAPQPPVNKSQESTLSLCSRKRLAPQPPSISLEKIKNTLEAADKFGNMEYADADIICNDSLKLDHGVLKPVKEHTNTLSVHSNNTIASTTAKKNNFMEVSPVSPRPWYKRNANRESAVSTKKELRKVENKYEPIGQSSSQPTKVSETETEENKIFFPNRNKAKRKSGISFLTNISELDREATEIIKKEHSRSGLNDFEPPPFMRPKQEEMKNTDSWISPKRKSAKDLIAKFNAITSVTKVTVNNAFFGPKDLSIHQRDNFKRDYFGKQLYMKEENKISKEPSDKCFDKVDVNEKKQSENRKNNISLMKSESAVMVNPEKKETPKSERKSWNCPKCSVENEYWRIICHVCSTIKPYFDDLTVCPTKNNSLENNKTQNSEVKHFPVVPTDNSKYMPSKSVNDSASPFERNFERSKTQIGFLALSKLNQNKSKESKLAKSSSEEETTSIFSEGSKREEREKLKKMLIEMKNSLRKKTPIDKYNIRSSIIQENPENIYEETKKQIEQIDEKKSREGVHNLSERSLIDVTNVIGKQDEEEAVSMSNKNKIEKQDKAQTEVKTETISNVNTSFPCREEILEPREENKAEAVIKTSKTIYENIKIKKTDVLKSIKVSSAAQTNGVFRKFSKEGIEREKCEKKNHMYELMCPKDFINIYAGKMDNDEDEKHIYANLIENGNLFLDMSVNFNDIKNKTANNTNTLEISRLLKRLESAIAKGELGEAANYARELAQLKVNCSVIRQKSEEERTTLSDEKSNFTVELYVEDKISHRGPFPIKVRGHMTVGELKLRVEREFEIPVNIQKWIIGKQLASDDNTTLNDLNVHDEGSPLFLYLVAPQKINEIKKDTVSASTSNNTQSQKEVMEPIKQSNEDKKASEATEVVEKKTDEDIKKANVIDDTAIQKTLSAGLSDDISIVKNTQHGPINNDDARHSAKEGYEDYGTKTLKTSNEDYWECIMCTLINPKSSNICAVCATTRTIVQPSTSASNQQVKAIRSCKHKTPQPQVSKMKEHYLQLVNLDNADLVENLEPFECLICFLEIQPREGVTLRECLHQFCKPCLAYMIEFSEEAEIKCPYRDEQYSCEIALQDREIKALVSKEVYDQYLGKSVAQAENKMDKSFHCKTPDCKGWCIFEDNVNEFYCPVCKQVNCLTCQAIHTGLNCKQFQKKMKLESATDENAKRTKEMLEEMVKRGEALTCPTCQVILMKKWGCDWLRCSMCKTEICWVTRGPRWGPGGKGDISGGCQCGVNGIKCHPLCNYCH